MKTKTSAALAVMFVLGGAARSFAADLPARAQLRGRSATVGLGKANVALLRKVSGPGARGVLADLEAKLAARGWLDQAAVPEEQVTDSRLVHRGKGWLFEIRADGTSGHLRREAAPAAGWVAVDKRMSSKDLETVGRQAIQDILASVVRPKAGEEIVALKTQFELRQGHAAGNDVPDEPSVSSNIIVFGRRLNGIDVIGPGSKIAVHVANNGDLTEVDFDWSELADTGTAQGVLPMAGLVQRARAQGIDGVATSAATLECGYFDGGWHFSKGGALVQAGCMVRWTATGDSAAAEPRIDVVPAGVEVWHDDFWPAARSTCNRGADCGKTVSRPLGGGPARRRP